MLVESADGDLATAIVAYEDLVRNLPTADPIRSDALYLLGRARWTLGDVEGAREALREGVRAGVGRARCLDLLDQIEIHEAGISTVPQHWTFDGNDHGVLHPWYYRDKGSIRIRPDAPGGSALEWSTVADGRKDDQLVVGFAQPEPPPRTLSLIAVSTAIDAQVRVLVFDTSGRKYLSGDEDAVVTLPRGEPVQVTVDLSRAEPLDPGDNPLDPRRIDRVVLQDVTAFYSGQTGPNTLLIDDFQVD